MQVLLSIFLESRFIFFNFYFSTAFNLSWRKVEIEYLLPSWKFSWYLYWINCIKLMYILSFYYFYTLATTFSEAKRIIWSLHHSMNPWVCHDPLNNSKSYGWIITILGKNISHVGNHQNLKKNLTLHPLPQSPVGEGDFSTGLGTKNYKALYLENYWEIW